MTHGKRGVVRCLHDRARGIISTVDNLQKEVDHLNRVLNFICNASVLPTQETADASSPDEGQEEKKGPLVVRTYVAGMSEDIRHVWRSLTSD